MVSQGGEPSTEVTTITESLGERDSYPTVNTDAKWVSRTKEKVRFRRWKGGTSGEKRIAAEWT